MVFNSLTFVVFFAAVLAIYYLPLPWKLKKAHLLVSSYLFYSAWNPPFVVLLWISTFVDWHAARWMAKAEKRMARRALLFASLGVNLGLLGFFKYGGFLLDNFVALLASIGLEYHPPAPDIFLPIGISFYTFQTLSYTIDVYRRNMKPWSSFLDFALFVTFFPQLVAGPIVRASQFLPQCRTPRRADGDQFGWGLSLVTLGLFEKVVLADGLMAPVADQVYATPWEAGFIDAWVGTLAFSGQIFFDFAGYSTCAIGVGMCLGFALPRNFRFPYGAIGFSDFWRRWHVSLSSWLRDYLYIPLGGNRKGPSRTYGNLMLTMLLGGLWHGAAWRFVVWGGLHGLYLSVERFMRNRLGRHSDIISRIQTPPVQLALALLTYGLVCITWVFFRAEDFSSALRLVKAMLMGAPNLMEVGVFNVALVATVTIGMLAAHWLMRERTLEQLAAKIPWWGRSVALALLLMSLTLIRAEDRAFIYFQF
jgi:D-alanyl-lipoteichoic acid acyltransferase DltB (MBOAT superfamily)